MKKEKLQLKMQNDKDKFKLKSANESKFWLALLRDSDKLPSVETNDLLRELTEIANILASSIITAKKAR